MEHGSTSAPTTPPISFSNSKPKAKVLRTGEPSQDGKKNFLRSRATGWQFRGIRIYERRKIYASPLSLSRNALIRHLNNDIQRGVWNRSREEHERVLFLRERRGGKGVEEDLRPRFLEIGPRWSVLGAAEAIFPRDLRETHRQLVRKWLTSLLRVFRFSTSFRITNWPPAYRGLKILPFLLN